MTENTLMETLFIVCFESMWFKLCGHKHVGVPCCRARARARARAFLMECKQRIESVIDGFGKMSTA